MWLDTDAVVTNRSVAVEDITAAAESSHWMTTAGSVSDSQSEAAEGSHLTKVAFSASDSQSEAAVARASLDLIVCDDIGGWELNTGVMLWRNTDWSRQTLENLWAMEHLPHMRGEPCSLSIFNPRP